VAIAAGESAPEFSLARAHGAPFTRSDLLGKTTVLDEFAARGATLYGVSCDAVPSQQAFREQLGVRIEQLSDFEPKGAACRAFGVLHPGGFPERALVVIGPDAVISWSYQAASPSDLPGANLIFDALDG
jgi:peroxiredoxin